MQEYILPETSVEPEVVIPRIDLESETLLELYLLIVGVEGEQ